MGTCHGINGRRSLLEQSILQTMCGLQGNSLKDNYAIAACVKHFAGYGAPTAGRYNTVELPEHTFREFYSPSYQAGIDASALLL